MGCFHSAPLAEDGEHGEQTIDIRFSNTSDHGKERNTRPSSRPSRARYSTDLGGNSASAFIGRHGSSRGVPSPSLSSVSLVPVARTGSYDVRVASRTRQNGGEGVIETSRLVIDHLKGNVFINQYLIIKDLGKGAHGTVKLVYNTHDEMLYAMKVIHKRRMRRQSYLAEPRAVANMMRCVGPSPLSQSHTEGHRGPSPMASPRTPGAITDEYSNEIAVMKELDHPNLVKLYEVIHDPSNNKLLMLMEYVEGGCVLAGSSPTQKVPIPEATAVKYFRDVVKGLEYLHFNRIVHGDLKPDNLLMSSSGKVKISDFGSARFCEKSDMIFATAGTPSFMAPEMCQGKQFNGFPGDIWALGVCLFMFVFGKPPFTGATTYQIYEAIQQGELVFPPELPVSGELMDLLRSLLQKDPSNRLSLEEIPTHPWVTRGGALPVLQTSNERAIQRVFEAMRKRNESGAKRPAPSTVPLAAPPEPVDMRKLVPDAEVRTYKDGEVIIAQGKIPEGLYYIQDGFVDLLMMPSEKKLVADEDFADVISDDDEDDEEAEAVNAVVRSGDSEGETGDESGERDGENDDEEGEDGEGGKPMDDFMVLFGGRLSDRVSPLNSSRTGTPRDHSASVTPRHGSQTLTPRLHSNSLTPRHASQSLAARRPGPAHGGMDYHHRVSSMPLTSSMHHSDTLHPPSSPLGGGHPHHHHHAGHPHHHHHLHAHGHPHGHHHRPHFSHATSSHTPTSNPHSRTPSMSIGHSAMATMGHSASMPRTHSASLSPRYPYGNISSPVTPTGSHGGATPSGGPGGPSHQAMANLAARLSMNGGIQLRPPSYSSQGAASAGHVNVSLSPSPLGLSCSNAAFDLPPGPLGGQKAVGPGPRRPSRSCSGSEGAADTDGDRDGDGDMDHGDRSTAGESALARSRDTPQSPFLVPSPVASPQTSRRQLTQEPSFNPRLQRVESGHRQPSRLAGGDQHLSTSAPSRIALLGRAASNRSASNLGPAAGTPTSPRNSYSHVSGQPQPHHGSPGPGTPPLPPLPPGQNPTHSHNTPTHSHQPHTSPPHNQSKGGSTVHDSSAQEDLLSLTAAESRRLSITAGSSKRLSALTPASGAGSYPHNAHSPAPHHHSGGSSSTGTTPPAPVSSAARATMSAVPSEVLDSFASDATDAASASRKANGSNDSIISNADISMQASGRKPAGWRRERPAPLQVSGSGSGLGQVQASPPGLAAMHQQHRLASIRRSQTHDLEPGGAVMTSASAWHGAGGEVGELEEGPEDGEARRTPEREHEEGEDGEEGDARESMENGDGYGHSSMQTLGRRKTPADHVLSRMRRHSTSSFNATSMLTRILGVSCSGAPLDRSSIQEWSTTSKLAQKAIQRSDSMHSRMAQMVLRAKQHAVRRRRRGSMQLITTRGPGSVVGELCIDSRPNPSPSTVVAKGEATVLLIKNEKVNKYRNQPSVMAALHRSQNASLVQEAMERFVECEQEVVAVEVIRRTITTEPNMHLELPPEAYAGEEMYDPPERYMADIYNG